MTNIVILNATGGGSTNPVAFVVASGPGVINGTTLTFTNAGTVSIVASQAGDANWNPAPNVTNTITVTSSGTLQFKSATYTMSEIGSSVRIWVSRTGRSSGAASVNYATFNGTATAGSDYAATSGTLNWSDGDATDKSFDVTIIDDDVYEDNEQFTVELERSEWSWYGQPQFHNRNDYRRDGRLPPNR